MSWPPRSSYLKHCEFFFFRRSETQKVKFILHQQKPLKTCVSASQQGGQGDYFNFIKFLVNIILCMKSILVKLVFVFNLDGLITKSFNFTVFSTG